jgi:tRNA G10  N-methylase Trm11
MECMIRFTQVHETFRLAEIEALAVLERVKLEILSYSPNASLVFVLLNLWLTNFLVTVLLSEIRIRGGSQKIGSKKHSCQKDL